MNENLKRLHKSLSELNPGFNVSPEQFEIDMQDTNKRRRLHRSLSELKPGFDVPYDRFSEDMGFSGSGEIPGSGERVAGSGDKPGFGTWLKDWGEGVAATALDMAGGILYNFDTDRRALGKMKEVLGTLPPGDPRSDNLKRAIDREEARMAEEWKKGERVYDRLSGKAGELRGRSHDYYGMTTDEDGTVRPKDYVDLWKEGRYGAAVGQALLEGGKSLPSTAVALIPGVGMPLVTASAVGQKLYELDKNPETRDMPVWKKTLDATVTGALEGLTERLGAKVDKKMIEPFLGQMKEETVKQILAKGGLNALIQTVSEGVEEFFSQLGENAVDAATGVRKDWNVLEGTGDAFVYGAGGGAQMGGVTAGTAAARAGELAWRNGKQGLTRGWKVDGKEADGIMQSMERDAVEAPEVELTPENPTGQPDFLPAQGDNDGAGEGRDRVLNGQQGMLQRIDRIVNPVLPEGLDTEDESNFIGAGIAARQAEEAMREALKGAEVAFDVRVAGLPPTEQKAIVAQVLGDERVTNGQRKAIFDYIAASGVIRQMESARRARVSERLRMDEERLAGLTNEKTGMLINARIKGEAAENTVNITGGLAVRTNEDGTLAADPEASDETVYYVDAEGRVLPTTADNVEIVAQSSVEDGIATIREAYRVAEEERTARIEEAVAARSGERVAGSGEFSGSGERGARSGEFSVQYPTDEKGEPAFGEMPVEDAVALIDELGDGAEAFVENNLKAARKRKEKADNARPRSTSFVKAREEAVGIARERAEAEKALAVWNAIAEYRQVASSEEQVAGIGSRHDGAQSQRGQQGSPGYNQAGERTENGNGTADSGGRVERDSGRSGVEGEDRGNQEKENDETEVIGRSMTANEAQDFIADMELSAEIAPETDLTIENWDALFGEDGIVSTPIGNVKMGENQFTKLMRQGRNGKLGMIKPTLEHPHAIVEDVSEAKEGDTTERASSYVFIRSFKKVDGSRYYYFTSITVSKEGKEVVVSNQEKRRNAIANLLTKGKMVWKHADDVSDASDMAQGLYSPQGNVSDLATEGTDAPQTTMLSDNKGTNNSVKSSELGEKIVKAEAEVDVNPTEGQKEAGNYKKGHVQVGVFDITIEQPKGSVRSGVDADGKKWKTTMQNTYGYIRGTEGVDGDHIDVFLSDDIDGWNGRRVFVVDQYNEDGTFDEHKVMLGFNEADDAEAAYFANYDKDWAKKHKTVVTGVNLEDFEKWIDSSYRKTKAFAEYSAVNKTAGQDESQAEAGGSIRPVATGDFGPIYDQFAGIATDPHVLDVMSGDCSFDVLNAIVNNPHTADTTLEFFTKAYSNGGLDFDAQRVLDKRRIKRGGSVDGKGEQGEVTEKNNGNVDNQGNPLNEDGTLKVEKLASVEDLTDEDFSNPTRNVQLPELPQNVDNAIGANGKPVIIKKNIFEKNREAHKFPFDESRAILKSALYNTDLVGQTQPTKRPLHRVAIKLDDKSPIVVLEVNENKDNIEVVGWYTLDERNLDRIKRQAEKNGGELVMLSPKDKVESLSTPQNNLSSTGKDSETSSNGQGVSDKIAVAEKETTTPTDAAYTITPAQYTTKRGKVLDMHLVKFNNELRDTVRKHTTMFAKQLKGWWDKEKQGFMMRSKEDAERLAEYATDAQSQPSVSMSDIQAVNDGNVHFAEPRLQETSKSEEKQEYTPVWQYSVSVDKETGLTTLRRDDVSGPIPIGDAHFTRYANSPEEMLGILQNQSNGMQEVLDAVGVTLENTIKIREIARAEKAETAKQEPKPENNPSGNRLVTDERYAELRERMRRKLGGRMNMGIDPEILAIGTEMAVYHIEKGARRFAGYATAMIADLGDAIRPYLKAFYNGARDLPEVAANGLAADMTPYEEVRKFDVANFGKTGIDVIAAAKTVTREAEVEQEAAIARERIKKSRPDGKKNGEKTINSQPKQIDLFGLSADLYAKGEARLGDHATEIKETTYKDNTDGLQGIHELRSGGLPADGDRNSGSGRGTADNEKVRKAGRGTDGGRESGNGRAGDELSPGDGRPVGRLQGLSGSKNRRNNRGERGKDYAPGSVDARIEANIKAIELAKQLLESGGQATEKQMQTLRRFSGWGGLGKVFREGTYHAPNPVRDRLRELLGEKAYQEAVMSANSAYYTPAYVVDTLWDIAEKMGFEGGNILEGSAGIGNILGQMPVHISERSNIHAIEIDGTSGGILSLLYPDAKVEIQGFEQTRIPNGSVDLAITNVPFVTGLRVNDTTGDKDLSKKFHNIHDFCIAKNVRKLREGGLGIFITSNGTLDNSKKLRDWVVSEGGADFVGAFRMHNKTFGGTGVTSDIVVVRKRVNGRKSARAIDVSDVSGARTAEYDTGETRKAKGRETPVVKLLSMDYNRYFIGHPENMAGEMRFAFETGDTFRPTSKGLYPTRDKKQEEMLVEFVRSFRTEEFGGRTTLTVAEVNGGKKVGEMFVRDGKLYINSTASAQPLEVNANKVKGHTKAECFEAYAAVKEALAEVLAYQTGHESDKGLKPLLDKLNKAYDDFTGTYGHFNKNTAIAFLRKDVDYANVSSVETYKESGDGKGGIKQTFGKADVMKGRVVEKGTEPAPTNVKDGIIASIFKFGRVDVPYIAGHLGRSAAEVRKEIVEGGFGFEDPVSREMEPAFRYKSGNVREKLRQAEENNGNGEFDRNIKALQEVMPMDIPAHLIDFTLGSSWIDPKLYEDFVKERTEVSVGLTTVGGTWFMKEPYFTDYEKNRAMGVTSEMLGRTIPGHTLIGAAITNKSITVSTTKKKWDGMTETVTDKEATQACAAKIDEIRQDFKDWARQRMQADPEMSERMERVYNDMFNNYVPMSIPDEFVPEYFAGASHKFKMRPHQGRAIVRGTMQPLMLAHEVGSGKTFTLISTAMEMRRLGTARKPMIVVQNATVGQFVADAKKLYPNAKILTLEEDDRGAEGRKNFYAKIRYNDWDMIVVPQSTFEYIPDSEEREMAFVQDKIEEKMFILEQMKEEDPDGRNMITRQAEREIELLEEQLAGLADNAAKKRTANDEKKRAVALQNAEVKAMEMLDRRTDDVENFDDMGIDALLVDEAHEYKHLGFATAMQRGVKGVDPSYSKKSQGVFLKTQAVLEKNNGRNVIFATGTPISNTAAEIWTFMRYLMPADTMKEYGIYYFDDFVRNFGNIRQMLEFTTSGKFKENNRFAGYVNLPELVRIWSGVADTVRFDEIEEDRRKQGKPDLRPEIEGGKAQDIYLPQTRALRSVMKYVKSELKAFDEMSGKEKKENSHIPLTMYGIAKAAAVDARLVRADAEDDPNSKTNEAVRQTLRSLKETDGYKGTVAIFADNYQNKQSGFNLYDDIRRKLIAEGVPVNEVVVIRSSMSDKRKLETFEKVNRGEVRVVLGSTYTLGTGVNIQERLHTLIHIDAPNRPMDYTQRNGRIHRQGNIHKDMNKPVRILRFGVEDSLDVTAYQRLKTKGAIADSIMNGKRMMNDSMTDRVLEEEEDVFGDTVAQLSGSEYAMLKNNAEKNVRRYASRKKQWETDQTYIHHAKPRLKAFIKDAEKRIEDNGRYLEAVRSSFPAGQFKEIVVGNRRFTSVGTMDDFFKEHNKSALDEMKRMKDGETAGEQKRELTIKIGDFSFAVTTRLTRKTLREGATLFNDVERKMTYSCPELGIEDVPVRQNLLRNAIEDITDNVITGKDFAGRIEAAERSRRHNEAELKELSSREGRPFEYEAELAQAKSQLEEYAELMKKELEEKEAKYAEMDASVETADDITNADEDDVLYRSDEELEEVNERFNEELRRQIAGTLPKGHVYQLGNPSDVLRSAGIPDLPIEMAASRLSDKSMQENHPFDLSEVENLPEAIQNPLAAFRSATHIGSFVVMTEIEHNGKNFVVAIQANKKNGRIEINDIRSIHYRTSNAHMANWIVEGLLEYADKKRMAEWLSKQRYNSAEVRKLFNHAAKIVKSFENPSIDEGNEFDYRFIDELSGEDAEKYMDEADGSDEADGVQDVLYHGDDDLSEINGQFNEELQQQIAGALPKGHVYRLGKPSDVLQSAGIPDLPIELAASQLAFKASSGKHDFDLSEVTDLPRAIANPIAVFAYGDKEKSQNILTALEHKGEKFLVGLFIRPSIKGEVLEINSIRNVFPKNSESVVRWITQGKLTYANKKELLSFLDQQRTNYADVAFVLPEGQVKQEKSEVQNVAGENVSKQRYTSAEVGKLFDHAAKVVKEFENPSIEDENMREGDVLYHGDEVKDRIEELFDKAVGGDLKGKPVSIGTLTKEGKKYLEEISGISFKEKVDFVLNPSDLIHIYKDHFGNNEKDKGQNIPLDIEDIRSLADVIAMPDKVVFFKEGEGSNRNMFYFFKKAEDGTYNLMEIYSDRKGNLTAKTFYKTRKDATRRVMDIEKSLLPTSETYSGAILSGANIPQMFETPGVSDENMRVGVGAYTDDEVSYENDPVAKLLGRSRRTARQRREFAQRERQRMAERVESLAEKLHLDNVDVITDASVLEGKQRRAKGFFNRRTGRITIVIPNHTSVFDAERTLLHEAVAHYGLRELFGERFDTFLDNVYEHAESDVRGRIARLAAKNGWDVRTATEEYLAGLAEDTDFENVNAGWWQRIRHEFLRMLHSIGFTWTGGELSDNELRYILWRSYENLREPGRHRSIRGVAEDTVKQSELGVGNYAPVAGSGERVEGVGDPGILYEVNARFNEELERYQRGEMDKNELFHLGRPYGVMQLFLPDIPIVMRQRVIKKGSEKKHNVDVLSIMDMPQHLSRPVFVFRRSEDTIGVLTDMKDRNGKNVCVAIELNRQIQNGNEYLEVNDVRSFHGREFKNIVDPIVKNKTLRWVDKEKGLAYLSSASQPARQEIDKQDLDTATKIVESFENPKVAEENRADKYDGQGGTPEYNGPDPLTPSPRGEGGRKSGGVVEIEDVNARFNEELAGLTEENADKVVLSLGKPSGILLSAGVEDKPMKLYGNKVIKKMKKHGFLLEELRDLPRAVANPIAVFNNYKEDGNRSVLTELRTEQGNFLVTIDLGKGQEDIDFNVVSSVFGKGKDNIVDWIEKGFATYIDKGKALNYLHHSALRAEALSSSRLDRAAKIVESFENPKVAEENRADKHDGQGGTPEYNGPHPLTLSPRGEGELKPKYRNGEGIGEFAQRAAKYHEDMRYRVDLSEEDIPARPVLHAGMSIEEAAELAAEFRRETKRVFKEVDGEMKKIGGLFTEFVDRGRPLEKLLSEMKRMGAKLRVETDAYSDFITSRSRATHLITEYEKTRIEPLQKTLNGIVRSGKLDGLTAYRWNITDEKTGEVLNDRAVSDYDRLGLYLQAKDIVEAETLDGVAGRGRRGFEKNVVVASPSPSGFSGAGSGVSPEDYIAEFERAVGRETVDRIWRQVRAVNGWALDLQLEYGLITRETYDEYANGERQYYVPQRGWRERDLSGRRQWYVTDKSGGPDNPFNAALVRARGRETLAGDPLAYMQSIGESSVMAALKNGTKQVFLRFAEENADFARIHDFFAFKRVYWVNTGKTDDNGYALYEKTYEPPTKAQMAQDKETRERIEELRKSRKVLKGLHDEGRVGNAEYAKRLEEYAKDEKVLLNGIQVKYIAGEAERVERVTAGERVQHTVTVLRDGKEYELQFSQRYGGERVANVLNRNFDLAREERTLKLKDDLRGFVERHTGKGKTRDALVRLIDETDVNLQKGTRFMSAMMTQYNPSFAAANMVRDMGLATVSNLAEHGAEYQWRFAGNLARVQGAVWQYAFNEQFERGNEYRDGYYGRLLREFFEDGAATGWSFLKDVDRLRKEMKRAIDPTMRDVILHGKYGVDNWGGLKTAFATLTEVGELTTRFAEYVTSRETKNADGTPKYARQEAAMHAKEVTTNFDRQGSRRIFGMLYSFFNATVQGTNKLVRMVRDKRVRRRLAAAASLFMAGGVLQALFTPDPDDDEERMFTEWELMNNVCLGKTKLPLPQGLRAFWGAGVQIGLVVRGVKAVDEGLMDAAKYFTGEMLPEQAVFWMNGVEVDDRTGRMGFDATMALRGVVPTVAQPLYDIWQNTNFMGGTSYRTEFTAAQRDTKAERTLGKRNVSPAAQAISDRLWVTGGGSLKGSARVQDDETGVVPGIFDVNPSVIETLVRGYSAGMGKFLMDMWTLGVQILDPEQPVDVSTMAVANVFRKQPREYTALDGKLWELSRKAEFYDAQYSGMKKDDPERYRRITDFHRRNAELRRRDPAAFERELRRHGTRGNRMFELIIRVEVLQKQIDAGRVQGKAAEAQADRLLREFEELR